MVLTSMLGISRHSASSYGQRLNAETLVFSFGHLRCELQNLLFKTLGCPHVFHCINNQSFFPRRVAESIACIWKLSTNKLVLEEPRQQKINLRQAKEVRQRRGGNDKAEIHFQSR